MFISFGSEGTHRQPRAAAVPEKGEESPQSARFPKTATRLAKIRNVPNVRFERSPSGDILPAHIGSFDFIMLSGVYEHMLPTERTKLLPQLWNVLAPGGVLFINQTPHKWFPYEHHSSGMWGVNYLPDWLAHRFVRHFSRIGTEINKSSDWSAHLRGGLRGGSEREVIKMLRTCGGRPVMLQPLPSRYRDRADYWLSGTSARHRRTKEAIAALFRATDRLFGTVPSMNLDLAVRKEAKR